jgi:Fis family transcriptional regulator
VSLRDDLGGEVSSAALGVESNSNRRAPLRKCVQEALTDYFQHMDGHNVSDLYQMVISEVEPPLLEMVMRETGGNQSKAALILGISRSTLRKKLAIYGLD